MDLSWIGDVGSLFGIHTSLTVPGEGTVHTSGRSTTKDVTTHVFKAKKS